EVGLGENFDVDELAVRLNRDAGKGRAPDQLERAIDVPNADAKEQEIEPRPARRPRAEPPGRGRQRNPQKGAGRASVRASQYDRPPGDRRADSDARGELHVVDAFEKFAEVARGIGEIERGV